MKSLGADVCIQLGHMSSKHAHQAILTSFTSNKWRIELNDFQKPLPM